MHPILPAVVVALALLAASAPVTGAHEPLAEPARVRIAILDSGIDAAHPEFAPGQVLAWRDFIGGQPAPYDDQGHGTAVASLAAGLNAQDCAASQKLSFSPGAPLIVGKVLNAQNGLPSRAMLAEAIHWALDQGARVVSISIGSSTEIYGTDHTGVAAAVARAQDEGVLVVVSAGNGVTADPVASGLPWPSWSRAFGNLDTPLAVGRANVNGAVNAGGAHLDPDVTSWGNAVCAATRTGGYSGAWYGSSFAAPLVAGMAARLMETADAHGQPSDAAHVKTLLLRSAHNSPWRPYAQEGMGFLLGDGFALAAAHASTGTFPDYDAQGAHAAADRLHQERGIPALRSLS